MDESMSPDSTVVALPTDAAPIATVATAVRDSTEMDPLPVGSPIAGFFWTWVLPVLLFAIATGATWMLYRHFSSRGRSD